MSLQLRAAVAAAHYGIADVEVFSGGTEATAFNPRAVSALRRAGFEIAAGDPDASNPRYEVAFAPDRPTLEAFSKKYDEPPNPTEDFAAVMTCSQADQSCPLVRGAVARIPIPPGTAVVSTMDAVNPFAQPRVTAVEPD